MASFIRKSITITPKQEEWLKAVVEAGDYTNESEYVRDLVRRDQEKKLEFLRTKEALEAGEASGTSPRTGEEIVQGGHRRIQGKAWRGRKAINTVSRTRPGRT